MRTSVDFKTVDTAFEPLQVKINKAAQLLSISRTKLYDLMNEGKLSYVKQGGNRWIKMTEIERYMESHSVGATHGAESTQAATER